ncbi:MAG: radical SAM protein [Myxococcales bacterium]|nr:radical SAM protein [Myxococcales bacterium]
MQRPMPADATGGVAPLPSGAAVLDAEAFVRPLIDNARQPVVALLRRWLGVPQGTDLTVRDLAPVADPTLRLAVAIGGPPPFPLVVTDATHTPALWRGTHLAVAHSGAGVAADRPLLAALTGRLESARTAGMEAELVRTARAWREVARVPPGEWLTFSADAALLRITFRCSQDCDFCWQDRDWRAPDDATVDGWIEAIGAARSRELTLSGGEPTLHPRLGHWIARARQLGLVAGIQTNAIRLARPDVLAALVEAGLQFVSISHHTANAADSDRLTRAPGTFAKTEAGIAACLAAGLHVNLNAVVDRRTLPGLPAHAEALVERFGAPAAPGQLSVSYSQPSEAWDAVVRADQVPPLDAVHAPLLRALQTLAAAGIAARADGPCGFPPCVLRGAPQGGPEPTPALAVHREGRAFGAVCGGCLQRAACIGVRRAWLEQHGERGLVPFL